MLVLFKKRLLEYFHRNLSLINSPPSSAEVKEWVDLYLHSASTPSWRCAQ